MTIKNNMSNINTANPLAITEGGTALSTTPTDGQLLIGSTSGNNFALANLTAGTGIGISNGSGTIAISATGGASSLVKIQQIVLSNNSSITFSGLSSTYIAYKIIFTNVVPQTNNVFFYLTFDATAANYFWINNKTDSVGGGPNTFASSSDSQIRIDSGHTGDGLNNTSSFGYSAELNFYAPNTSVLPYVTWHDVYYTNGANFTQPVGAGGNTSTAPVTSITLQMSSGNMATGIIELYGLIA